MLKIESKMPRESNNHHTEVPEKVSDLRFQPGYQILGIHLGSILKATYSKEDPFCTIFVFPI